MEEPLDLASAPLTAGPAAAWGARWRDAWRRTRERLYANPRLYDWSLSLPWAGRVTRRRTQQLFDLMAGFVHSQVLLACVRLDLFRRLRDHPADLDTLARTCEVAAPALQRLVLSAVALDLLETRSGGRYGLGPLGVPLATYPGLAGMIEHHQLLYDDLRDPLALLRDASQARMGQYWPYAADPQAGQRSDAQPFDTYSTLMDSSQDFLVQEILRSYPLRGHRRALDVGASKGRLARALALHAPQLRVGLFDLPPVLALARATLAEAGLLARADFHPGSFLTDELPAGADLITLVRVAHDHPDRVVRLLLRKIHDALAPGGTLLLAEPMAGQVDDAGTPRNSPATDAYYHFYLLAMGAGRLRSPAELMAWMREAGFEGVGIVPNAMPIHGRLLAGLKPKCLP